MLKTILILSLIILTTSITFDRATYDAIKEKAEFEMLSFEEVNEMFKDREPSQLTFDDIPQPNPSQNHEDLNNLSFLANEVIPLNYDPRTKYPLCAWEARDQEHCGSCYAFCVTSAFELRYCVQSNQRFTPRTSPQHIVSCDKTNRKCKGGTVEHTWEYIMRNGIVEESCFPYASQEGIVPACRSSCTKPTQSFKKYYAKPNSGVYLNGTVTAIKIAIFRSGPINSLFQVYKDLYTFKGGIYRRTTDEKSELHGTVIVGWGVDVATRTEYWILKNSWGAHWGERGYFRMPFNYLEIEKYAYFAEPQF